MRTCALLSLAQSLRLSVQVIVGSTCMSDIGSGDLVAVNLMMRTLMADEPCCLRRADSDAMTSTMNRVKEHSVRESV